MSVNMQGDLLNSSRLFTHSIFYGRDILIATSHKKEIAIAPIFKECFGANIIIPDHFNTDQFGTFTGEIERKDSPLDAARKKCQEAHKASNVSLVIASEGSFGPHPTVFFVPADEEILLLTDYEYGLEIAVREVSTKTNFSGREVKTYKEVKEFAQAIGFPDHKVILRKAREDNSDIVKDIADWKELCSMTKSLLNKYDSLFIETDMRAMNNPSRMYVIAQAAKKLTKLLVSTCPCCQTPGFDISDVVSGLPCSLCSSPTGSILKHVYVCKKCSYKKEIQYPNSKKYEDPMYCDWCNP